MLPFADLSIEAALKNRPPNRRQILRDTLHTSKPWNRLLRLYFDKERCAPLPVMWCSTLSYTTPRDTIYIEIKDRLKDIIISGGRTSRRLKSRTFCSSIPQSPTPRLSP